MAEDKRSVCNTILLIEDDAPICEAVAYLLEMEGYNVVKAADGRSGMNALKDMKRPCLILLDLMMPIMDGWEFLDALRNDPDVSVGSLPVIITSAAGSATQAAEKKAQGLIRKPIDLDLLLATVHKYCAAPEVPIRLKEK